VLVISRYYLRTSRTSTFNSLVEKYVERGYNDKVIELVQNNSFLAFDLNKDGKTLISYIIEKNNMNLLYKILDQKCVDPDILDAQLRPPLSICLNFRNTEALKVSK
jgi:hypothetical protein